MSKSGRLLTPHPLGASSLKHWLRVLLKYGRQISLRSWLRTLPVWLLTIFGIPGRLLESIVYGGRIRRQRLNGPPVFIIGHWRSGTTNLHNLMLQDSAFGCLSLLHCVAPHTFMLTRPIVRWVVGRRLPKNRPMDKVRLGLEEPMSEDFGLVGVSMMTHYYSYFFPQIAGRIFRETILGEGCTEADFELWRRELDWMLRKVTLDCDGRRLLLKNPAMTGRIPELLKLYPDAKFIHVTRNPYPVHASSEKLMRRFCANFALQDWSETDLEQFCSERYAELAERWERDRTLIPSENLVEVRHEEVIGDQVGTVARIYEHLGLPGFEEMKPAMEEYVESLKGYENNVYSFDEDWLNRVNPYLKRFADQGGYSVTQQ